jgi:hypothetical protein
MEVGIVRGVREYLRLLTEKRRQSRVTSLGSESWVGGETHLFTRTTRLVCGRWNPVALLANQVERHAYPEFAQFTSSPSCGLQFANRSHRVSAHRSMRRKVACQQ